MTTQLCTVDPCFVRGRHTDDGCDKDCGGCLPGLAVDGLRVCHHHQTHSLRDLHRLPALDAALTFALVRDTGAAVGGNVTGSTTPGLDLNPAVFEHRDLIREWLTDFIAYAAVERGFTHPDRWDVPTMVGWLERSHDWFLAGPKAAAYVRRLGDLAARAYSLAYPSGTRVIDLGPCTEHTTTDQGERTPCTGTLRAVLRQTDAMLPSELTCDGPEPHHIPPHEWVALGRRLHSPTTKAG